MTAHLPVTTHERSQGAARVALGPGGRLARLRQEGSAKAILPATGGAPEIVFLNTSGGLTGGDRLTYAIDLSPGVRATGTTQTAERAYRSTTGAARVEVRLTVGAGGRLDWLPQETILFDRAQLVRRTEVDLAPDAGCLMVEAVVLGRAAMGETVREVLFRDTRTVRRAGRAVLIDPVTLTTAALAAGPACLGGARAFASLAFVAPGAEDALGPMRAVLDEDGVMGGASAFDGKLTMRLMAADGWPLRRQLARVLTVLRRAPLPRVWQI